MASSQAKRNNTVIQKELLEEGVVPPLGERHFLPVIEQVNKRVNELTKLR